MRLVDVHAGAIQSAAVFRSSAMAIPPGGVQQMATRRAGLCNSAWAVSRDALPYVHRSASRIGVTMPDTRSASCNCGAIRIEARGEPIRAGICHCTTCRKESGGPFMAFAVWHADHVKIEGRTASWKATRDDRHFCPFCGSTLFGVEEGTKEIEVRLGAFDAAPTDLVPTYELWVRRRERWLQVLSSREQFAGGRTEVG